MKKLLLVIQKIKLYLFNFINFLVIKILLIIKKLNFIFLIYIFIFFIFIFIFIYIYQFYIIYNMFPDIVVNDLRHVVNDGLNLFVIYNGLNLFNFWGYIFFKKIEKNNKKNFFEYRTFYKKLQYISRDYSLYNISPIQKKNTLKINNLYLYNLMFSNNLLMKSKQLLFDILFFKFLKSNNKNIVLYDQYLYFSYNYFTKFNVLNYLLLKKYKLNYYKLTSRHFFLDNLRIENYLKKNKFLLIRNNFYLKLNILNKNYFLLNNKLVNKHIISKKFLNNLQLLNNNNFLDDNQKLLMFLNHQLLFFNKLIFNLDSFPDFSFFYKKYNYIYDKLYLNNFDNNFLNKFSRYDYLNNFFNQQRFNDDLKKKKNLNFYDLQKNVLLSPVLFKLNSFNNIDINYNIFELGKLYSNFDSEDELNYKNIVGLYDRLFINRFFFKYLNFYFKEFDLEIFDRLDLNNVLLNFDNFLKEMDNELLTLDKVGFYGLFNSSKLINLEKFYFFNKNDPFMILFDSLDFTGYRKYTLGLGNIFKYNDLTDLLKNNFLEISNNKNKLTYFLFLKKYEIYKYKNPNLINYYLIQDFYHYKIYYNLMRFNILKLLLNNYFKDYFFYIKYLNDKTLQNFSIKELLNLNNRNFYLTNDFYNKNDLEYSPFFYNLIFDENLDNSNLNNREDNYYVTNSVYERAHNNYLNVLQQSFFLSKDYNWYDLIRNNNFFDFVIDPFRNKSFIKYQNNLVSLFDDLFFLNYLLIKKNFFFQKTNFYKNSFIYTYINPSYNMLFNNNVNVVLHKLYNNNIEFSKFSLDYKLNNDRLISFNNLSIFENIYLNGLLKNKFYVNRFNYKLFKNMKSSIEINSFNKNFFYYLKNPYIQFYIYNVKKNNSFFTKNSLDILNKNNLIFRKLNYLFVKKLLFFEQNFKLPYLLNYRNKHNLNVVKKLKWNNNSYGLKKNYLSKSISFQTTDYDNFPHFVKYKTLYDNYYDLHDREYNYLINLFFNEDFFIVNYPKLKSYNMFDVRYDYLVNVDRLKVNIKNNNLYMMPNYRIYKLKMNKSRMTNWDAFYKRYIYRTTKYYFSFKKKNNFNSFYLDISKDFFTFSFFSRLFFFIKYLIYNFFFCFYYLHLFYLKIYNYLFLSIYTYFISFFFFFNVFF